MGMNSEADVLKAEPPHPIIYLSRLAAERAINGYFPFQLFPLGGADYRKSYEDLSLPEDQRQVFQVLNRSMEDYPYAVVTRNSLFFRSDDNCSVIGDTIQGVNIAEACRNHDYCYRQLGSPMNSEAAHADFLRCNEQFTTDIINICKESGKECSRARIYGTFLSKMSYIVFRRRQSAQAEMVKDLLAKLNEHPEDLHLFSQTNLFNFAQQTEGYRRYCTRTKWSIRTDLLYPNEKSACDTAANLL